MKPDRNLKILCALLLAFALSAIHIPARAQSENPEPAGDLPSVQATRCDPSLPIRIRLIPENEARVGQVARFSVEVESDLDPDLVRNLRVEYETADSVRVQRRVPQREEVLRRTGRSNLELGVVVPDERRYSIRARLVVEFTDGKTISQTAVQWIDLGEEDPPEGMIDRIVDPDGTVIRVYQGVTVRN